MPKIRTAAENPAPLPYGARRVVTADQSAAAAGVHVATFWAGVASGRFPKPVYPAPKAPRWFLDEIEAALEATRALPCEAKAQRMARRNAAPAQQVAA
ncbi:helix-turn-helix transcriptional regulator [Neoroseomonas oryzicola]|uniref:AlpA family phage regulatory protein n=1 Tax=Neoroseomonas oryzicola TaxID=535904 RepID=A0A9X9WLX2_9PROT|nr:hypothetical protein [Neoroseomonas oryzicola]MBR0661332.1 hypothetical protein [Neoroseomonas oryzicola]NKE18822.1 hypothetical protein [Neoroseomonas oryzicola]